MTRKNYNVITLCGSTKFKEQFQYWNKRLTLMGNVVLSVGCFVHSGDDQGKMWGMKQMLDDIHKQKIDMSNQIFVINKDGYIGQSTSNEIKYAQSTGKIVLYLETQVAKKSIQCLY